MERLNLDDYNSDDYDEYLFDNMETTPPAITEAQAAIKQDPPAPPPVVTVTVQLEEQSLGRVGFGYSYDGFVLGNPTGFILTDLS